MQLQALASPSLDLEDSAISLDVSIMEAKIYGDRLYMGGIDHEAETTFVMVAQHEDFASMDSKGLTNWFKDNKDQLVHDVTIAKAEMDLDVGQKERPDLGLVALGADVEWDITPDLIEQIDPQAKVTRPEVVIHHTDDPNAPLTTDMGVIDVERGTVTSAAVAALDK